jgi:hypothetical protein
LLDAAAIVVGYGMASLLIRAFWPAEGEPPWAEIAAIASVYVWLGLAMSGPVVLLVRRSPAPHARSWAEVAWLIIGFYWVGLTVLVVPVRLHRSPLHDSTLIGLLPIAAAGVLRLFDQRTRRPSAVPAARAWTHHAAVALLWTWPLAWVALILLGKSLL